MTRRTRVTVGTALAWAIANPALADTTTRWVVARDYRYGGGSATDAASWRSITWVWRSEVDLHACLRSIFSSPDPDDAQIFPLETRACRHARLARAEHRAEVEMLAADPGCGHLITVRFRPDDRERLDRVQGCVAPARLAPGMPGRIEAGRWIFAVDVGEEAGTDAPRLHRIGSYGTWKDCEDIRSAVQRDLTAEGDDEALEGSRLAAAGACLPEELLD